MHQHRRLATGLCRSVRVCVHVSAKRRTGLPCVESAPLADHQPSWKATLGCAAVCSAAKPRLARRPPSGTISTLRARPLRPDFGGSDRKAAPRPLHQWPCMRRHARCLKRCTASPHWTSHADTVGTQCLLALWAGPSSRGTRFGLPRAPVASSGVCDHPPTPTNQLHFTGGLCFLQRTRALAPCALAADWPHPLGCRASRDASALACTRDSACGFVSRRTGSRHRSAPPAKLNFAPDLERASPRPRARHG